MTNYKIENHKCVDVLIFNNQNNLALQMRSANDDSFPSHWDFSAGGHVDPNEEEYEAAKRETFEELGVFGEPVFISKEYFQYKGWKPGVLRELDASIYKMINNGPFKIDSNEVEKVSFFDLESIQKMIDSEEKFHPEFLLAWKKGIVLDALNK